MVGMGFVLECGNSGKEVNPTLRLKAGKNFLAKSISSREIRAFLSPIRERKALSNRGRQRGKM
jgi:hypothetical protein